MRLIIVGLLLFAAALGCSPTFEVSAERRESQQQQLAQSLVDAGDQTLRKRVDEALEAGRTARILSSDVNAAWQIMHGVISYGQQLQLDTPDRGRVSALDYAFTGGQLMGFEIMGGNELLPATGRVGLKARLEPGSYIGQGHVDQWVAIFAMANLPLDTVVQHGGQQYTLLDWARQAQYDASRNLLDEYSWTLIALTHFFPDEPRWVAADGKSLSWELLVEAELTYDIDASPCGGTHRLAGITRALKAHLQLGPAESPESPVWQEAQQVVDECLRSARENRGASGGLSSFYFARPGATADLAAELASSGHLLEFVSLAAPESELSEPWVELAVMRLCDVLQQTRDVELDCGALYHALNGLKIYRDRRFGD